MESIKQEVRNFVVTTCRPGEPDMLGDHESLMELGLMDSFGVIELVSFLQKTYGIDMSNELSSENLDSIANISDFVASKVERNQSICSGE